MVSVKLDDALYLKPNLTLKLDGKFIIIFNDGVEVKKEEYADATTAQSTFNGIITAINTSVLPTTSNALFLDLDTLL